MNPFLKFFDPIRLQVASALLLVWALTWPAPTLAGGDASDGHTHDAAPAATSGPALPRFAAQSDLFEVVGVLNASGLSMLIDRYDSNEPVLGAKVEIESGSFKAEVPFHADLGDYAMPAEPFNKPGTYPITLTITAGDQTDLLAGELVVPDAVAVNASEAHGSHWPERLGWALAATLLAAAALWALRQFRSRRTTTARI